MIVEKLIVVGVEMPWIKGEDSNRAPLKPDFSKYYYFALGAGFLVAALFHTPLLNTAYCWLREYVVCIGN